MKTRKLLAAALSLLMILAFIPAAAIAEGAAGVAKDAQASRLLDRTWSELEAAEAEALEAGLTRSEVINAVYSAALNSVYVDADSFSDFDEDGFFFTVDGMYNAYDFRLRNEIAGDCEPVEKGVIMIPGSGDGANVCDAESPNVLLVGPYYGHDNNFTDQYRNEAASVAEATGGTLTILQSTAATGPAIAENFTDRGVVFFDSHGTQSGNSSYLCLTTKAGITSEDFSNGWAVNAGSAAYIDGRYIQHHVSGALSNTFVWMAICEGMMRQGQGTTGYALLEAGAGAVYGYSQSVTFGGDYLYEEVFWNVIKDEGTAQEAYNEMISVYGIPDPYGDAYPILMSPVDPFPSNPDGPQTVNCTWTLYGFAEPTELTGFSLGASSVSIYESYTKEVSFLPVPADANLYEIEWTSSDESIAAITGNSHKCRITGHSVGSAEISCNVYVDGELFGTASCGVTVVENTALYDALNIEGGDLEFTTTADYPFRAVEAEDRFYAESGNHRVGNSDSTLTTVVDMRAGDTLTFDYWYGSEAECDYYNFRVNGQQILHLEGTNGGWDTYTYTAASDGTYTFEWNFNKDPYVEDNIDGVRIDNVACSVSSEPADPDGDLNGDGATTTSDALIALRAAMHLIDTTDIMLEHGDMDGNGSFTATDAMLILRTAMGIIS